MHLSDMTGRWDRNQRSRYLCVSVSSIVCLCVFLTSVSLQAFGQQDALPAQLCEISETQSTSIESELSEADGSNVVATDLGVLTGQVDDNKVYRTFLRAGLALMERDDVPTMDQLNEQLKSSKRASNLNLPGTEMAPEGSRALDYQSIAKASLMFGTIYDCGRCDRMHANIAGGVVVSEDGLALTNFHVLDREDEDTKTLFAMTFDGKSHPIVEVLATDKVSDVALVRLGGEGPFFPAPLAKSMPLPMEPVKVLSHPSNEYFVLTEGVISRHVKPRSRGREQWTEITAPFGAGSSGSGVFNSKGEVVGLVSRIFPIRRSATSRQPRDGDDGGNLDDGDSPDRSYVELILKRCVTLNAIHGCFKN